MQPATYGSPSGRWTLAVDPAQRDGHGSASYVLRTDGELAWRGDRPWTIWDAVVTDAGFVGGYAYTYGGETRGEFHALVLSPDGETLRDSKVEITTSRIIHGPPDPTCRGVIHVPVSDRLIFRVADAEASQRGEEWWYQEVATGRELFRKRPDEQLEPEESTRALCAARSVAGTALVIVQWWHIDPADRGYGARFGLFDADGELVWQLVRPDDWEASDRKEKLQWMDWMRDQAALPEVLEERRFALWSPALEQRFNFEVVEAPGESPAWKVVELGSEPQARPAALAPGAEAPIPELRLESLPTIELESVEGAVGSPVRDVVAFAHESAEVVRFVRTEDDARTFTLLHVDTAGRVLSERDVVLEAAEPAERVQWWPISDRLWLATQSPPGNGERSTAWSVDDDSGSARFLEAFSFPSIMDVAGFGDGRFVAVGSGAGNIMGHECVAAFDADGVQRWRLYAGWKPEDPAALFAVQALAVTADGRVAVLDNTRHSIQIIDEAGTFERFVDLDVALGQEPNYPSGLSRDMDNGLLLHDFNGEPPLWRLDAAGTVRARLTPTLRDGRSLPATSRNARVAPDGKVWTTDGQRLLRLDEQGCVELEIGDRLEPDALREPKSKSIDALGRVLVQDGRTGAVHVFGADGARRFVGVPVASDVGRISGVASLRATREGGVLVERDYDGYLLFGPQGEPLGVRTDLPGEPCVDPATGTAVGLVYSGLCVLDSDWQQVRTIERHPDGRWLGQLGPPAMDRLGSIAVVEQAESTSNGDRPLALLLYGPGGEGGRRIELPASVADEQVALGRDWAVVFGYKNECWLVERSSGHTSRFRVPDASGPKSWRWGVSADGLELLALEPRTLRLHRFALP